MESNRSIQTGPGQCKNVFPFFFVFTGISTWYAKLGRRCPKISRITLSHNGSWNGITNANLSGSGGQSTKDAIRFKAEPDSWQDHYVGTSRSAATSTSVILIITLLWSPEEKVGRTDLVHCKGAAEALLRLKSPVLLQNPPSFWTPVALNCQRWMAENPSKYLQNFLMIFPVKLCADLCFSYIIKLKSHRSPDCTPLAASGSSSLYSICPVVAAPFLSLYRSPALAEMHTFRL